MKRIALEEELDLFQRMGYQPTQEQMKAHVSDADILLCAGGIGGGKSVWTAMEMLPHLLSPAKDGRPRKFHLVGATYKEPRTEFEIILNKIDSFNPALLVKDKTSMPRLGQWFLQLSIGNTLETLSADDPLTIRAFASDGAAICEAGIVDIDTFYRISERLNRTKGFLLLSGTFESSQGNRMYQWYADYWTMGQGPNELGLRSFSFPAWSNYHLYPGGRQDPQILLMETMEPEDLFMERYAAVPCPPRGRVLKEASVAVHVRPHDEMLKASGDAFVELWVDPGRRFAYAVEAVCIVNDEVLVLDEVYERERTSEEVIQICQAKPWWKRVRTGVIDIAGTYPQIDAPPVSQIWEEKSGIFLRMEASRVQEEDGIERLRSFLMPHPITRRPKLFISSSCTGLLGEMGLGRPKFEGHGVWVRDENTGRPKDQWNHASKALAYGVVHRFGYTRTRPREMFRAKSVSVRMF